MKKVFIATVVAVSLSISSFQVVADTSSVAFQGIPEIMAEFDSAKEYREKVLTYGRLPHRREIGRPFPTYVADENGKPKLETENVVSREDVIARNPEPVSGAVFNEWLVPKEQWQAIYGVLPDSVRFIPFKRIRTIRAIPITDEILSLLGSKDGETAVIAVEGNEQGMTVYKNGYLAEGGYGITPEEMVRTYEEVKRP